MKQLVTTFIIISLYFQVNSQNVQDLFTVNSPGEEIHLTIENDTSGNIFLAGTFYYPRHGGGSPLNLFIEKRDSLNQLQWRVQSNNPSANYNIQFNDMAVDLLGNAYLVGMYKGDTMTLGGHVLRSNPGLSLDFFVTKINPQGQVEWLIGPNPNESFPSHRLSGKITVTQSQQILISGSFFRQMTIGNTVLPGNPNVATAGNPFAPCGFLAKISPSGSFSWAKQYEVLNSRGGNGGAALGQIISDPYNNYYNHVTLDSGIVIGTDTILSTDTTGWSDICSIVKFDSLGNLITSKILQAPISQIKDMTLDRCGNLLVLGNFQGTMQIDQFIVSTASGRNAFVAKFDTNLNCIWLKSYGSTAGDRVGGIVCNRWNEIFFNFDFWGTINFETTHTPSPNAVLDVALVKLDSNGNYIWSTHTNGTGVGYLSALDLSISNSQQPIFLGSFRGEQQIQGITFQSAIPTESDPLFGLFNDSTLLPGEVYCNGDTTSGTLNGIHDFKISPPSTFKVYPNPNEGQFQLEIPESYLGKTFQLSNISGQIIFSFVALDYQTHFSSIDLPQGIYFITCTSTHEVSKVIVQ